MEVRRPRVEEVKGVRARVGQVDRAGDRVQSVREFLRRRNREKKSTSYTLNNSLCKLLTDPV